MTSNVNNNNDETPEQKQARLAAESEFILKIARLLMRRYLGMDTATAIEELRKNPKLLAKIESELVAATTSAAAVTPTTTTTTTTTPTPPPTLRGRKVWTQTEEQRLWVTKEVLRNSVSLKDKGRINFYSQQCCN